MNIKLNIESKKGDNIESIITEYENSYKLLTASNLRTIVNIVIKRLKQFARAKKWKSIPGAIRSLRINDNEFIVFPDKDKAPLIGWLHSGTRGHYIKPKGLQSDYQKTTKALHWVKNGKDYFSRGHWVRGLQPTNFFRVTPDMQSDINHYIKNLSLKNLFKYQ